MTRKNILAMAMLTLGTIIVSAAPKTKEIEEASGSGDSLPLILALLALAAGVVALVLSYNEKQSTAKRISELENKIHLLNKELSKLKNEVNTASVKIQKISLKATNNSQTANTSYQAQAPLRSQENRRGWSPNPSSYQKSTTMPPKTVKYTTFLIDESGQLRTEQRVMTDDNSTHLFKIEYEENANTAIYTINPVRKKAILSDLQTFQNYTERFVVTGTPNDIHVVKEGKLSRSGKSWIVTEKLVVSFT